MDFQRVHANNAI